MHWKSIVTELLWFLRGDTNIKYLVDNNTSIWNGDCYKRYSIIAGMSTQVESLTQEEFINRIKTDDEFAKQWGELGPIYGKQWRSWEINEPKNIVKTENVTWPYEPNPHTYQQRVGSFKITQIDQIANLINDLKTNPDSRRLMVSAWNVGELDSMVLPPCHYGFQMYTRELSWEEQVQWVMKNTDVEWENLYIVEEIAKETTPKRAISLMWNQRSVDFGLGAPFNIASYGLLLEIIAKEVNMIPDELIGNLGDVHLYLDHVEPIKEQLNRDPFILPKLKIKDKQINDISQYNVSDFELIGYQSHPTIKLPLSN
jgi:thymidylate synthase